MCCEFFSWLTSCVVHRGARASRKRLSVFGVAMNRDPPNLLLNPHGTPAAMHRRLPAGRVGCSSIPKSLIQATAVRRSAANPQASRDSCRRSTSEHIADSSAAPAASGYFMSQTLSSVPDRPLCQRQHRMGRRVGAKQQSEGSNDCHSRVTSPPPTSCGN
jgi:hypothetical protein